ncbi:MAG: response regulator, partial [Candidatus Marinimicrobia bacterium]|nr:response regulator [Candidatus Neomarinimicrobiota bacterium]
PLFVKGDALRLRQIIVNLIGNSIKFTQKGSVTLKVVPENRVNNMVGFHFMVIDTGIGIPADKQEIIFSSFNQADNSISRKFGGTGLGLTICKQLVNLMGGEIWVESDKDQGTTFHFTIYLEQGDEKDLPQKNEKAATEVTQDLDILLVDDNNINCEIASHILQKDGHKIVTASNGLEALEIFSSQNFDLIFMDVQMPVMDGLTASAIIRACEKGKDLPPFTLALSLSDKLIRQCKGKHIPIIAMTANAMEGDKEKCLTAGMDSYLTKPFNPAQIRRIVIDTIKN